jgi:hypothetical protein
VTGCRLSCLRRSGLAAVGCLVCAACALMVGCGSAGQPRLDASNATKLRAELASAASASAAGDRLTTLAALDRFKARVDRLAATDRLAHGDARALNAGVSQALAAARRQLPPPAPAVVTSAAESTPPTPTPPAHPAHDAHPKPGPDHNHHDKPDKGKKADG